MRAIGEMLLSIPSMFKRAGSGGSGGSGGADASEGRYFASTVNPGDMGTSAFWRRGDQAAYVASYVSTTYTCARIISLACASATLRLYRPVRGRKQGRTLTRSEKRWMRCTVPGIGPGQKIARMASNADDIEEVTDSPVVALINNPNDLDVSVQENALRFVNLDLCGNHYVNVIRSGNGEPEQLFPMYPQWTRIVLGDRGPTAYRYGVNGAVEQNFPAEDVIHFKGECDPQDRWYGRGPLKAVWGEHQVLLACTQKQLALFDNQARPDFVVTAKGPINENTVRQLEQNIRSKLEGTKRAGKFIILGGGDGIEVKPLTFAPKDLAESEMRSQLSGFVAAAFGVPESMIRLNDANLASASTGNVQFARNAILPRLNRDAAVWTEKLLPLYGYAPGDAWLAYDNPVPEDEVSRSTVVVSKVNAGILTINEARAEDGYEPVEGGDVPRINGQSIDRLDAPAMDPLALIRAGNKPDAEDEAEDSEPPDPPEPGDAPEAEPPENAAEKVLILRKPKEAQKDAPNNVHNGRPGADPDGGAGEPAGKRATHRHDHDSAKPDGDADDRAATPGRKRAEVDCDCTDAGAQDHGGACGHESQRAAYERSAAAIELARKSADIDPPGLETEPPEVQHYRIIREWLYGQRDAILAKMDSAPMGYWSRSLRRKSADDAARAAAAWTEPGLLGSDTAAKATMGFVARAVREGAVNGLVEISVAFPDAYPMPQNATEVAISSKPVTEALARQESAYFAHLREVSETTAKRVSDALIHGIEAGETLPKLKDRVKEQFDGLTPDGVPIADYRAANIVRTEIAEAQTTGTLSGWKATGLKVRKKWLLAGGACTFCEAAAEQFNADSSIDLDEPFYPLGSTLTGTNGETMAIDYRAISGAPLHPQCRCAVSPVLAE